MAKIKRRISLVQIIRITVQLLALIFFPGIFILTFNGIKEIFLSISLGDFNFMQALPRMTEVIAIIPITVFAGRFFCGWLCAFGAFNDFIYMISNRLFKIKFKINEKLDAILKTAKYIVLAAAVYLIWISGSTMFEGTSPWDAFAQLPNIKAAAAQYTIGFILLVGIVIGAMFVERFFCRYLCPLGAVFALTSRLRGFNIEKPRDKCGNCRLCTNKCAMGIQLFRHDEVTSGECINCFKCIEVCPRKNPKAKIWGEDINQIAAAGAAIVLIGGLYVVTNFAGQIFNPMGTKYSVEASQAVKGNNGENQKSILDSQDGNGTLGNSKDNFSNSNEATLQNNTDSNSSQQYKDGTYIGTGRGYRPGLKLSITIKGGKITDVEIISSNETPRFSQWAFNTIPKEIIQSQSPDVDSVSGATRSSNGIMQAVEDALSQAKK